MASTEAGSIAAQTAATDVITVCPVDPTASVEPTVTSHSSLDGIG